MTYPKIALSRVATSRTFDVATSISILFFLISKFSVFLSDQCQIWLIFIFYIFCSNPL